MNIRIFGSESLSVCTQTTNDLLNCSFTLWNKLRHSYCTFPPCPWGHSWLNQIQPGQSDFPRWEFGNGAGLSFQRKSKIRSDRVTAFCRLPLWLKSRESLHGVNKADRRRSCLGPTKLFGSQFQVPLNSSALLPSAPWDTPVYFKYIPLNCWSYPERRSSTTYKPSVPKFKCNFLMHSMDCKTFGCMHFQTCDFFSHHLKWSYFLLKLESLTS